MAKSKKKSLLSSKGIRAWARQNLKELEESPLPQASASFRAKFLDRYLQDAEEGSQAVEDSGIKVQWGQFESANLAKTLLVVPFECPDAGQEMENLCRTLQLDVSYKLILSKSRGLDPATYIGSGTVEKIRDLKQMHQADSVVFEASLSPVQVRNLEDSLKCPVVDRQGVILEIFRHHAQSKMAKLQVELAHLKYLQPRLAGIWMGLSRQSGGQGGLGGRGLGETRLELDRRVVKDRISSLNKKLKEAEKSFSTQSSRRSHFPRVALVGYTNAGKSSIMNLLTKAQVSAKNELFHTLDTTVRPLQPITTPRILVSDTVGFVRDLPHDLVASFKSTLREALESRLLLVVLDASDEFWKEQYQVTKEVLDDIGGAKIPRLVVFNKTDQMQGWFRMRSSEMKRHFRDDECVQDVLWVSALKNEGIVELRSAIIKGCGAEEAAWNRTYDGQ